MAHQPVKEHNDGNSGAASTQASASSGSKAALAEALKRLNDALADLDKSVDSHLGRHKDAYDSDEQVQRVNEDRARLAKDLDQSEARANTLKEINSEVSRRLVGAMEMVRGVLDKQG